MAPKSEAESTTRSEMRTLRLAADLAHTLDVVAAEIWEALGVSEEHAELLDTGDLVDEVKHRITLAKSAERERDEARAEVERMRPVVDTAVRLAATYEGTKIAQTFPEGMRLGDLRAAVAGYRAALSAPVEADATEPTPEDIVERASQVMQQHRFDPGYRDADRNDGCVCGGWISDVMSIGWDDHLAEALAAAGLLAEAGAPDEPTGDTAAAVLRDLVAHWDDEDTTLPSVTDATWASQGERLGRAANALRKRARALVAALSGPVPSQPAPTDTQEQPR